MSDKPCEQTGYCSSNCFYYDFTCGCTINKIIEEPRYKDNDTEN